MEHCRVTMRVGYLRLMVGLLVAVRSSLAIVAVAVFPRAPLRAFVDIIGVVVRAFIPPVAFFGFVSSGQRGFELLVRSSFVIARIAGPASGGAFLGYRSHRTSRSS